MNQRGFAPIIVLVVILFAVAVGGAYYLGQRSNLTSNSVFTSRGIRNTPLGNPTSTPSNSIIASSNAETYTNQQLRFQVTYPAQGLLFAVDTSMGNCGSYIKVSGDLNSPSGAYVDIDDLVHVKVISSTKSINQYLSSIGLLGHYSLTKIPDDSSGADDSVEIGEPLAGYKTINPQLIEYIYKKNIRLYLIMIADKAVTENPQLGVCMRKPENVDISKYPSLSSYYINWKIISNIKFF